MHLLQLWFLQFYIYMCIYIYSLSWVVCVDLLATLSQMHDSWKVKGAGEGGVGRASTFLSLLPFWFLVGFFAHRTSRWNWKFPQVTFNLSAFDFVRCLPLEPIASILDEHVFMSFAWTSEQELFAEWFVDTVETLSASDKWCLTFVLRVFLFFFFVSTNWLTFFYPLFWQPISVLRTNLNSCGKDRKMRAFPWNTLKKPFLWM